MKKAKKLFWWRDRLLHCLSIMCLSGILGVIGCKQQGQEYSEATKPNIIYILADDLGYGDLGCYGQELIETPNIDKLADGGMRFTQHYAGSAVCAPSRYMLLTGKHPGHAFIRGNDEWDSRGDVWSYHAMAANPELEGQRPIPATTVSLQRELQKAGYSTAAVGKWGLGAPGSEGAPNAQGFDFFFGYNCQRQAHTYYPLHLYRNDERVYLQNDTVAPHQKLSKEDDPYDMSSYEDYTLNDYSPDLMLEEIQAFINENKKKPFFLYWATPIPHAAIQAPRHWVDYYVNKFGDEEPYLGNQGYFPHRYPRAGYAAMVSYLDEHVGVLVEQLKKLGIYDNTLIIFTSDNGPTYNGGTDSPWFDSGGPFPSERGRGKGYLYEGGIRVPMIAQWPNKIEKGSMSDHICAFWDVFPTLMEVSGTNTPPDLDGISFLPTLLTNGEQETRDYLYWEFPEYNGQQAVRMGKWKAIRKDIKSGNLDIELYNLEDDLAEQNDVANHHPDIVAKVESIFKEEHSPAEIERFRLKALGDDLQR